MQLINTTSKNITLMKPETPYKRVKIKGKWVNILTTDFPEKYIIDDIPAELPQISVREIPTESGKFIINGEEFPVVNEKKIMFENLPPEKPGVIYITSARVCRYISKETNRHDFVFPNKLLAKTIKENVYAFIGTLSFERV